MDDKNGDVALANGRHGDRAPTPVDSGRGRRVRLWINWVLTLLTVPAAAIVLVFGLGAVMSAAACSDQCPSLGPGGIRFTVLFYGAPVVALLTIVIAFFTAKRRWGIVVPLCGWASLIADIALLAVTFRQ